MLVAAGYSAVDALYYKVPVHRLLTVEKMAAEDETKGLVLLRVGVDHAES